MKLETLMNCSKILLIQCWLMQFSAIGQNDSINYQDISKHPLTIIELQQIAKLLPQAESYYYQVKNKEEIIVRQNQAIDSLQTLFDKNEKIEQYYKKIIELKNKEIELIKPEWWQKPIIIATLTITSLIVGVLIAK